MKVIVAGIFIFISIKFVKNDDISFVNGNKNHKSAIYAELLSDTLEAQRWEEDEKPCLDTMTSVLDNAKNFTLWAVWILDSIQLPLGQLYGQKYHVGNYDQCLKPDYGFQVGPTVPKTQYCEAEVTLTSTNEFSKPIDYVQLEDNVTADVYLKKQTKHGRIMSKMVWGICVPKVCQPSATAKVMRSLLQISHLGALSDAAGIDVTRCQNRDALKEDFMGLHHYIIYKVLLLIAAITILCTYLVQSGRVEPDTFVGELASSFNLSRNMESLTRIREDEVYSMNVMRVATSIAIVFCHYDFLTSTRFIVNGLDQDKSREGEILSHTYVTVDTFLTLSGLLFVRGLFNDKSQNLLKFIWKRYVRLMAAMVLPMFYVSAGFTFGNGPMWSRMVGAEMQVCSKNWLANLLMISNMYVDKMCILVSWYVPCDFQLCLFATILYAIYKKDKIFGKCAFAVSFIAAIVISGLVIYANDLAPLLFHSVESFSELRQDPEFVQFYVKSYCRAAPFMVGAMMGYIMYTYKPKDYRKIIGIMPSYLGLVFSLILMYEVFAIGHHLYFVGEPLNSAIYAALHTPFWGLAICIIIGVSEYGNLFLLVSTFSWYPLVPLSRLTCGVYLNHINILGVIFATMRTNFQFDILSMVVGTIGVFVLALLFSLIIWLLVEAPINNINNMLLDNAWWSKPKEYIRQNNAREEKKLM